MKRFYIFVVLFFIMGGVFYANAQDLIILKNGKTEVINSVSQPSTKTSSDSKSSTGVQTENQPNLNSRLNTIGATVGYQGVSAYGFTLNGTVSPANYTFFDFNLGLGFNSLAFNGRINFNAFVPFKSGGWYAGAGIGGGYNELLDGVFAGNITTGFILFNWLNIAYTLQFGTFEDIINHNIVVGYSYRFKSQQNTAVTDTSKDKSKVEVSIPVHITPLRANVDTRISNNDQGYIVNGILGNVQYQHNMGDTWDNIKVGDIFTNNIRIRTPLNTTIILLHGNETITIPGGREGRIDSLLKMR